MGPSSLVLERAEALLKQEVASLKGHPFGSGVGLAFAFCCKALLDASEHRANTLQNSLHNRSGP